MLRAFIAIEVPSELQRAIADSTAALKSALPKPLICWVIPQNVHLTLKFLGDVSPASLEKLADRYSNWKYAHTACSPSPWAVWVHSPLTCRLR